MLEIAHGKGPGICLERERDVAPLEHRPVGLAQDRDQHFPGEIGIQRCPVDVEECRVFRRGPVFQHVHPPWVVVAHDRDVIGHHVAKVAHAVARQRIDEPGEILRRADFRIQHPVIDDVVAMPAARPRAKIG